MIKSITEFINIKGLKAYLAFILFIVGGFLYLQLNGILIYNTTSTEHEASDHSYSNSHHK